MFDGSSKFGDPREWSWSGKSAGPMWQADDINVSPFTLWYSPRCIGLYWHIPVTMLWGHSALLHFYPNGPGLLVKLNFWQCYILSIIVRDIDKKFLYIIQFTTRFTNFLIIIIPIPLIFSELSINMAAILLLLIGKKLRIVWYHWKLANMGLGDASISMKEKKASDCLKFRHCKTFWRILNATVSLPNHVLPWKHNSSCSLVYQGLEGCRM